MTEEIADGHTLTKELHDGKKFTFRRPLGGEISVLFGKLKAEVKTNENGEALVAFDSDADTEATCEFIAGCLTAWWRDEPITPKAVFGINYLYHRQLASILVNAHFELPDGAAEKN